MRWLRGGKERGGNVCGGKTGCARTTLAKEGMGRGREGYRQMQVRRRPALEGKGVKARKRRVMEGRDSVKKGMDGI